MTTKHNFELSYIVPLYFNKNTDSFFDLLEYYSAIPREIISRIQFVFVDDCSPVPIEISVDCKLNYQLYRIKKDIRWNQPGARNLGAVKARTSKLFLTDLDHFVPESLLRKMLNAKEPNRLYKFKRIDHNKQPKPSHSNTFFTSKSVFFGALGYDEEFCGNYGFDDSFFKAVVKQKNGGIRYFSRKEKIQLAVDDKSMSHNLERDTTHNKALFDKKLSLMEDKNRKEHYHSGTILNFEWEKIHEQIL